MHGERQRLRNVERWIAWIRLGAVPFAIFQIVLTGAHPPHLELLAWITAAVLAIGAAVLFVLSRRDMSLPAARILGLTALVFDTVIICGFLLIYHFEPGSPIRQLLYVAVVEAAIRYGIEGPLLLAGATAPVLIVFEWLRSERVAPLEYRTDYVTFQIGAEILLGLIVGWLVRQLRTEMKIAGSRAAEAERLRDELGRRVDLLEAANRCARALGSSLVMEQAFNAFIRELRGLIPFDRVAIVLGEGTSMRVIAAAGLGADQWLPAGSILPRGALVEEVIASGQTVYRTDMAEPRHPEEHDLVAAGLRCRLGAPLLIGARATGMLAVLRREPDSFSQDEIELVTLLGRLVGTAVQNIRAYDAEHHTVEELRRLSALRADFVSLVSHELRSPMAAVIGSARTLQVRWRELSPEQRESFLALIGDETNRLSELIADVLDTSRIEAGTFSYRFSDVLLDELVRETVAAAALGQDEVEIRADVRERLPAVRGDRDRLRQVLMNLIDNAVKYSPAGDSVLVSAYARNGRVRVDVADRGPGIALDDHGLIFEKFGRANLGQAKPGTGLGLFIARSIAEAHGGTLSVRSAPLQGATFSLELPAEVS
jgi:signal transduction histidine kinase